jgi:hypothetical protein
MVKRCLPVGQPPSWRAIPPYLQLPGQGGPAIPQATGTHFGRLLRPAFAAVVLFFFRVATRVANQ